MDLDERQGDVVVEGHDDVQLGEDDSNSLARPQDVSPLRRGIKMQKAPKQRDEIHAMNLDATMPIETLVRLLTGYAEYVMERFMGLFGMVEEGRAVGSVLGMVAAMILAVALAIRLGRAASGRQAAMVGGGGVFTKARKTMRPLPTLKKAAILRQQSVAIKDVPNVLFIGPSGSGKSALYWQVG